MLNDSMLKIDFWAVWTGEMTSVISNAFNTSYHLKEDLPPDVVFLKMIKSQSKVEMVPDDLFSDQ